MLEPLGNGYFESEFISSEMKKNTNGKCVECGNQIFVQAPIIGYNNLCHDCHPRYKKEREERALLDDGNDMPF